MQGVLFISSFVWGFFGGGGVKFWAGKSNKEQVFGQSVIKTHWAFGTSGKIRFREF